MEEIDYVTNAIGETGKQVPFGFEYSSDKNPVLLTPEEIGSMS